ncbi:uncharacterized protein N7511_008220 [Penicillium nucicola]|uniref:uncharacterized protein n=1 Tax=Penicillium nucicola TaxID=1850975 RepID=UPI0025458A35|nr:uncharacterized protein N7511_008220 [Penicillium nucicola]KAJ5754067.1 hypothetical protein N7511_008220 [Penicillium nucicola]
MASSRSTRPVRSNRTQVQSYHEESSSHDEGHAASRRESLSLRSRTTRMPKSYREESTDGFDEPDEPDEPDNQEMDAVLITPAVEPTVRGPASNPRPPRPQRAAPKPKPVKKTGKRNRGQVGKPLSKRPKIDISDAIFFGSGIVPPWQTLPYHILLDIFLRASHPLLDEGRSSRNDSVKWLVSMALLCRSFHEPALAALYYSPPLLPAYKAHTLLHLVSQPQESLSMNYSSKIKELHVEVEPVLQYKSGPTLGYFDLSSLLERTPQLHGLRLYHRDDFTVGMPTWNIGPSKWTYPESIFAVLHREILLRSFEWNSRFMETGELLQFMSAHHMKPAFRGLRELKLLHFDDTDGEEQPSPKATALIRAVNLLPEIEKLEIIESSLANGEILTKLPPTIRSLTLNNCERITSQDVATFLSSHGANLRELSLSHNRYLSMSFIQDLAQLCPSLVFFKMDISIHDVSSYHDVEPQFNELLAQSEVPTWPETLQEIELTQLRKWNDAAAEVFFTSLVNAAPKLRDLRRLAISAILKIGWRDRATFRERWIGQLEKTFLRRSPPPDPNLRSLRKRTLLPTIAETNAPTEAEEASDSRPSTAESGLSSKRQSVRLAQKSWEVELDDDEPLPQSQGMCDIVNIRIDNQRPTEMQYNENDFLDDELSGDEDWAGDDFEPVAGHAW